MVQCRLYSEGLALAQPSEDDMSDPRQLSDRVLLALAAESAEAGDAEQVVLCERALNGDAEAMAACVEVVEYAEMRRAEGDDDEEARDE